MSFQKHGDVEKHEVVTPEQNKDLNDLRRTSNVKLEDIDEDNEEDS
jgi:hypothetical protein